MAERNYIGEKIWEISFCQYAESDKQLFFCNQNNSLVYVSSGRPLNIFNTATGTTEHEFLDPDFKNIDGSSISLEKTNNGNEYFMFCVTNKSDYNKFDRNKSEVDWELESLGWSEVKGNHHYHRIFKVSLSSNKIIAFCETDMQFSDPLIIATSPDNKYVLTNNSYQVSIWAVSDLEHIASYSFSFGDYCEVFIAPNSNIAFAFSNNGTIDSWNLLNGRIVTRKPISDCNDIILHSAFNPKKKLLACLTDKKIQFFNSDTFDRIKEFDCGIKSDDPNVNYRVNIRYEITFSTSGDYFLISDCKSVRLFDTSTFEQIKEYNQFLKPIEDEWLKNNIPLTSIFDVDERSIFTACFDGSVHKWE